ncbi:MAG: MerR family transcriptional regulator [Granulosicoccus sp.]
MSAKADDAEPVFSITDLAQELDLTTRTIHFYEDGGLLRPARRGQQRVFSRADRTRLRLALPGNRLGWPLDNIREMIELYDTPNDERKQLTVISTFLAKAVKQMGQLKFLGMPVPEEIELPYRI